MNAQQLEQILRRSQTVNNDRALLHAIMALNEENQDLKRSIKAMAEAFDKLSQVTLTNHAVNMKLKNDLDANFNRQDDDPTPTKLL